MRFIFVFVYVSSVLAALPLVAQDFKELLNEGRFHELFEIAEKHDGPTARAQAIAWTNLLLGRQDLVGQSGDGLSEPRRDCLKSGKSVDGAQWVLRAQAGHKVVMFSEKPLTVEAHLFLLELLPQLRELGFTHIGLEAFHDPDKGASGLNGLTDDTDIHEPVLTALIHRARALGFELFSYAVGAGSDPRSAPSPANARASGQADILLQHIEKADAEARFLVLAGPHQITEGPNPIAREQGRIPMAAQVKKSGKIDPLTVDLVTCRCDVDDARPSPSGWLVHDEDGNALVLGAYAAVIDAQIALPLPSKDILHAGYYRQFLGKPVFVPDALRRSDMPVLVQARRSGQSTSDIAVDRVLLRSGENLPLYLPSGEEYFLIAYGGDGHVVAGYQMRVD